MKISDLSIIFTSKLGKTQNRYSKRIADFFVLHPTDFFLH